jgi:hypothetical protein
MNNKKIPTSVGTIVLIIIALTVFGVVWKYEETQKTESVQNQNVVAKQTENQGIVNLEKISNQRNSINWAVVQFDDCGGKEKYDQMSWWSKFIVEIKKKDYYSDSFIESQLKSINNNTYLNPGKIVYTYQSYCNDVKNKNHSICKDKDKKLSMDNFNSYGEGCLSKDNSAFIVVFPGEYLGGGNYVFRYDIINNTLEEAQKIIDDSVYWNSPPVVFGERTGNVIKMTGKTGDAGCSLNTDFDYNIVANQIKMTKKCTRCINEKQNCKTF